MSARRRVRPELEPLNQGELDCLCGVYAIVNAVRLAAGRRGQIGAEIWADLFRALIATINQRGRIIEALTWGLDARSVWQLSRMAARHLHKHHDVGIRISKPLKRTPEAESYSVMEWLRLNSGKPRTAVVIGIEGVWVQEHWTVVTALGQKQMRLYDSCDTTQIPVGEYLSIAATSVFLFDANVGTR